MFYSTCRNISKRTAALALLVAAFFLSAAVAQSEEQKTINALFIGNSFTGRHNLSEVVKAMAEAGNPGLRFEVTTIIYGGRTLKDHWRLGSQNFVRLAALTKDEQRATIRSLEETVAKD